MAVFEFSESVSLYLGDAKLRSAIDDLTEEKMLSGFDAAFEWREFPDFVDAWISAQKVVGDWSKDLYRLWDETWGAVISPPIPYASRYQAIKHVSNGGIVEAWIYQWYARAIEHEHKCVNLLVLCEDRDGKKGIFLQVEFPEKPRKGFKIAGWGQNDDEFDGPFHLLSINHERASLDLDAIREDARIALEHLGLATDGNDRI